MYLTIIIPCLNEAATIGECIDKANKFIMTSKINANVLVVDNGSSDDSATIARVHGATVITETKKGYGNAIIAGIKNTDADYIIFGDADCSYDFEALGNYILKFKEGYDFVNGNRFANGISKHAMSWLHRLGVPFLSFLGRCKYKVELKDFHCGLRGFKRSIFNTNDLKTGGMEFATEIIAVAARKGAKITEVPITLYPDKRNGPSHLRTFKDGFRHLKYILLDKEK